MGSDLHVLTNDESVLRALFTHKWRLPIIVELLMKGPRRLSELERAIPAATKKMLIDSLHSLQSLAWVERRKLAGARGVQYLLKADRVEQLARVVAKIGAG